MVLIYFFCNQRLFHIKFLMGHLANFLASVHPPGQAGGLLLYGLAHVLVSEIILLCFDSYIKRNVNRPTSQVDGE
jgi:hypothetical protein